MPAFEHRQKLPQRQHIQRNTGGGGRLKEGRKNNLKCRSNILLEAFSYLKIEFNQHVFNARVYDFFLT
jgi:hypothetical protein